MNLRNLDFGVRPWEIRLTLAFGAALIAASIGLAAPEASTDVIYRMSLIGFIAVLVASRIVALSAFGEIRGTLPEILEGRRHHSAREIADRRASENIPTFVSDAGLRAGV